MSSEIKDEYSEASANMRHYGNLQFAALTVFLGITAGLTNLVFSSNLPDSTKLLFKLSGVIVSIIFFVKDISDMYLWTHFVKRAAELESALNYKQYSSLPGAPKFNRIRPAALALWVFYGLVLCFWVGTIIWHTQLTAKAQPTKFNQPAQKMKSNTKKQQHNKALHPTAYSFGFPLVPRSKPSLPAAGELSRSAVARGVVGYAITFGAMSKFLDGETRCLYLDQFAACRVFAPSPPTEWADIAALIKQGINAGKFLCPNSIEQMIETTGMDKESARLLDSESRKFSSGWCFFPEADITANYLICRVREIKMEKHHFVHNSKQNPIDAPDVYEKLGERNEIFRQMVEEGAKPANIIRKAARGGARGKKDFRDVIVQQIKNGYAQEIIKRMFWLGSQAKYVPRTVTLAGHTILFWADVVCHLLVSKHRMTQLEAQAAFWILEKEGIDAIPSLSIRASLEAMLAYRGVVEISNDQVDILRVAGALPFADMMVVDGSKANDVRELALDKKFRTNIYSGKTTELENLKNDLTAIVAAA